MKYPVTNLLQDRERGYTTHYGGRWGEGGRSGERACAAPSLGAGKGHTSARAELSNKGCEGFAALSPRPSSSQFVIDFPSREFVQLNPSHDSGTW